jgi:ferric-dicitrate binding protein FerR (iron transport regulator)
MDELGLQLAELAEEAADGARPAGPAAARRRGARRRRRQATGALVLVASLVAGLVWVDRRPLPSADATKGW